MMIIGFSKIFKESLSFMELYGIAGLLTSYLQKGEQKKHIIQFHKLQFLDLETVSLNLVVIIKYFLIKIMNIVMVKILISDASFEIRE